MDGFCIKFTGIKNGNHELGEYSSQLRNLSEDISGIKNGLRMKISCSEQIDARLRAIISAVDQSNTAMKDMQRGLESIVRQYQKTDSGIASAEVRHESIHGNLNSDHAGEASSGENGNRYNTEKNWWNWLKSKFGFEGGFTEDELNSIITDDEGEYGGNQGSPMMEWGFWSQKKELYQHIRKHLGENMTDKECAAYLQKLNSEGCGYVSIINTIFAAYEGREEEFEKTFGFPMYHNGDLNYDRLLVDFYAATDNHIAGSDGNDWEDVSEDYDPTEDGGNYVYRSDKTGWGTTQYTRKYRTEMYLKDKGVPVEIQTDYDVRVDNFKEASKDGYIIMSFRDGYLQNEDGTTAAVIDGGHAMTVIGTTSDGRYKVSSWGKEYYIDPNQNAMLDDGNGGTKDTSMTFSYVSYGKDAHKVNYY